MPLTPPCPHRLRRRRRLPSRSRPALALFAAGALAGLGTPVAWADGEAARLARAEDDGATCLSGKLERAAEAADAFDEATGRDLRHYPPDRLVDHRHMKLELRFDDIEVPRFTAVETLRVRPIGRPTESLTLDAVGLDVGAVRIGTRPVEHFLDDETITLRFDPPLALGRDHDLVFEYVCDHPYAGIYFTPSAPEMPEYTAEVHTQGETITNRHWFIAHDAPNERLTTELVVDVPAEYAVSSNGRLESRLVTGDRAVWHYLQDKPHTSYLVTLVIGRFDVVEIPHERVPMHVWVPRGKGPLVPGTYGRTGEMIDLFERRFGVPYPWDRYDQLVVKSFGSGGMENTSATTMYPTAILDETARLDGDLDSLIAHELCHQWTGDLYTCKEWAHIWLNEGFATFGSALWFEYRDGEQAYLNAMRRNFRRVVRRDRTTDPLPMVSPVYDHPGENFRRGNPYPKGASILHMLRSMLGENVFWDGIELFMTRHALGTVETHDLRYAMEEVSGRGLEWFFDQWCFRPGSPELDVRVDYDGASRALAVTVDQTQTIDARTPAFRFRLPIYVRTPGGGHEHVIEVSEKTTAFRVELDGVPDLIAIDPRLHVLADVTVTKPERMWTRQAMDGPTLPARHRAVARLGEQDTADNRALLAGIVRDEGEPESLRNRAVAGLAGYGSDSARAEILAILDEGLEEAKVRADLVGTLDGFEAAEVGERLARIASTDPSYDTRRAAIRALGALEAKDHADVVAELVEFPSQHDRVRQAALRALADFDDPRGLDLAIRYAAYGYMDRSRPAAIAAIGTLAHHDPDRAFHVLADLLDDPQRRPASAAGRALAKLGDERARDPLSRMAETHPNPARRKAAKRWLDDLDEAVEKKKQKKKEGEGKRAS